MASPTDAGYPLQVERCFSEGTLTSESQLDLFRKAKGTEDCEWQNLIVQGDNLQFLKTCYQNADPLIKDKVRGKVRLIYIDPPFATKADFRGTGDERSYSDKVHSAEFIEGLRERLVLMRELLAPDGTIYLHLDLKMSHYMKIVMDEIYDSERFLNEIIWRRTYAHSDAHRFGQVHDSVLMYRKLNSNVFNKQYRPHTETYLKSHYGQIDNEGKRFRLVTLSAAGAGPARRFGDKVIAPPKGRHWAWSQTIAGSYPTMELC